MQKTRLEGWIGLEGLVDNGWQVERIVNKQRKDMGISSLEHTMKGGGVVEGILKEMEEKAWILGCKDPKQMKEIVDLGQWILGHKDPKWSWKMED